MSDFSLNDVLSTKEDGIRLTVRAKPGLSRARSLKIVDVGDGKCALEVSVAAEAREGKANKAIAERLAKELGVSKKQVSLVAGDTGRLKIVAVDGDPEALIQKLKSLL